MQVLAYKVGSPEENMAEDASLIELANNGGEVIFRQYAWDRDCVSYGYFQDADAVQAVYSDEVALVKRPTGGGVVDHRGDWTYAMGIPVGHVLYQQKAMQTYAAIHECIAGVLREFGIDASLCDEASCCGSGRKAEVASCFVRPVMYDVVDGKSGRKLAGAAQRKTRQGLLVQGSIQGSLLMGIERDEFFEEFVGRLCGIGVVESLAG